MKNRKGMVSAALAVGVLLMGPGARAQDKQPGVEKIEQWVIENTRAGAQAEFFVVLRQANLAAASQVKGKAAKGELVYRTLLAVAQESQRPIIAELEARGVEYQS